MLNELNTPGRNLRPRRLGLSWRGAKPQLGIGVEWETNFEFPDAGCWELELNAPRNAISAVSVNGRPRVWGDQNVTGGLGAAAPMYFTQSAQLFAMTPHARALDALRRSLVLYTPSC